jgi:hypothetical protein
LKSGHVKGWPYLNFRNFEPVIEKAKEACLNSAHRVEDHFEQILEMVSIGSGAQREVEDWALSRYACVNSSHPASDLFVDITEMVGVARLDARASRAHTRLHH